MQVHDPYDFAPEKRDKPNPTKKKRKVAAAAGDERTAKESPEVKHDLKLRHYSFLQLLKKW